MKKQKTTSLNKGIKSIWYIMILVLVCAIFSASALGSWGYSDWQYRKAITIDQAKVAGDLAGFPVLIDITDPDFIGHAQSSGDDFLFTTDDGITKLDHEIESYDSATGHLVAWVRSDLSSINDSELYLYYGNSGASTQENPEGVWDEDYVMVQHFEETSGDMLDSTLNYNDAGSADIDVDSRNAEGKIGNAYDFESPSIGTGNSIRIDDSNSLDVEFITISAWVKLESFGGGWVSRIIDKNPDAAYAYYVDGGHDNNRTRFAWYNGLVSRYTKSGLNCVIPGSWYYLVVTLDDSKLRYYSNGAELNNYNYGGFPINPSTDDLYIGNREDLLRGLDGILDELRISKMVRSLDWLLTEYNNQKDPGSFACVGSEEVVDGRPILSDENPENGATGIEINPELAVDVLSPGGNMMEIIFRTNASGTWQTIGEYNGTSGIYTQLTIGMDEEGYTYHWAVNAREIESDSWTNETYSFTTQSATSLPDWQFRKAITIDHEKVGADLTGFPVLIDIIDSDIADHAKANGDDILFTSKDGITNLNHEIESYDSVTGHLVAWVKTGLSSIADTELYIYYGNSNAASQENPEAVWDDDYVMVHHFEENYGDVLDSTSYANDADSADVDVDNRNAVGKIGSAYDFQSPSRGTGDFIMIEDSDSLDVEYITISAWLKLESWGGSWVGRIVDKEPDSAYAYYADGGHDNNRTRFAWNNGLVSRYTKSDINSVIPGSWYYLTMILDDSKLRYYSNGAELNNYNYDGLPINPNNADFYIGNREDLQRGLDSIIDELRISKIGRSQDWISTEYNNQHDPDSFMEIGHEELVGEGIIIFNEYPNNGATGLEADPELAVDVLNTGGNTMDIVFRTNASGAWQTIGTYNGGSGTYAQPTSGMDEEGYTYHWAVNVREQGSSEWINKTYSFTLKGPVMPAMTLSEAYPHMIGTSANPQLSVKIENAPHNDLIIQFRTNASGTWQTIGSYTGGNGVYTQNTQNMDVETREYHWIIRVNNGTSWITETYKFAVDGFRLKWSQDTDVEFTVIGPLTVDVDGDGIYEVFATGQDKVTCMEGITGEVRWTYTFVGINHHAPFEIHDLNNDGTLELVVAADGRTIALHADDGSVYWNVPIASSNKYLVIADIVGDGYPYVYVASDDVEHWDEGTGRLSMLNGTNGELLAETFAWRPCWGGLSIADLENDGDFELFLTDRPDYYHRPNLAKGLQAFDAHNLSLLWEYPELFVSANLAVIVDVNKDGVLDAVAGELNRGGICVIDGATGEKMPGKCQNYLGLNFHSPFPVYDIDGDGNLEVITNDHSPLKVFDLENWNIEATLGTFTNYEPPNLENVMGDERLEIVAPGKIDGLTPIRIFDGTYTQIATIDGGAIGSIVQDIDDDGLNELIVINSEGVVRAYETGAYALTPRPRTGKLHYSERNMKAGEYVPLPGAPQPFIKQETPSDGVLGVELNPELSAYVVDFRHDEMDITFSTNASGVWEDVASFNGVGNAVYSYMPDNMDVPGKVYHWRVSATDTDADNLTATQTFSFMTAGGPAIVLAHEQPENGAVDVELYPELSVYAYSDHSLPMDITFEIYVNGSWEVIQEYNDVPTGTYTAASGVDQYSALVNWRVTADDGTESVTETYSFTTTGVGRITDSEFNDSADSQDLRDDAPGQDWYESRNDDKTLLELDETDVGGDSTKKAKLVGSAYGNAYLTQEFSKPLERQFSAQWDIYIDSIIDIVGDDFAGIMLIGDDSEDRWQGPNYGASQNFAWMAFYKNGGGTSGTMDLMAIDDTGANVLIAAALNIDQWYTIKVIGDLDTDTYDVYVDGELKASDIASRSLKSTVTHLTFAQWNDGAGTFYVDNVR